MKTPDVKALTNDVVAFLRTWGMWDDDCIIHCEGKQYTGFPAEYRVTDPEAIPGERIDELLAFYLPEPYSDTLTFDEALMSRLFNKFNAIFLP